MAAPRCPPAPRPARMRRMSSETAGRATAARACKKAVEAVNGEIRNALDRLRRRRPARARSAPARSRRHGEQEAARRQRHSRRVDGRGQGRSQRAGRAALSLYRRGGSDAAARADDEHHQWRRACRQSDRLPGIHDRAGGRLEHRRGGAHGRRSVSCAEARAEGRGPQHQLSATRAASLPISPRRARRSISSWRRSRPRASCRARTSISRSTWRRPSYSARAAISSKARSGASPPSRWPPITPSWSPAYPIFSIEDGMSEDDWDGWRVLTEALGRPRAARRRRSVRHQCRAAEAGHRPGHRQCHPGQGQPDRHAQRDARRRATWRKTRAMPR